MNRQVRTSDNTKFSLLELDIIKNSDTNDRHMPAYVSVLEKMENNIQIDSEDIDAALSKIKGVQFNYTGGDTFYLVIDGVKSNDPNDSAVLDIQIGDGNEFQICPRAVLMIGNPFQSDIFVADTYQDLVTTLREQIEIFKQSVCTEEEFEKVRNVAAAIDDLKTTFFRRNEESTKEQFAQFLLQTFELGGPGKDNMLHTMKRLQSWSEDILAIPVS